MLFIAISSCEIPHNLDKQIDGIELRLDLLPRFDLETVRQFLHKAPRPVILTLRKGSQGGNFFGEEEEREQTILQLLKLEPAFFDLESDMRPIFLKKIFNTYSKTRFILSHHDFEKIPQNLEEIYGSMFSYSPFTCKIAVTPRNASDVLRMFLFVQKHPYTSIICMGERGTFFRILGKIAGNIVDYTHSKDQVCTGPGQLPVEELFDTYHYSFLNAKTSIYGLIGNPVEKSLGAIYHNRLFREKYVNAVYVKITVDPEELPTFIPLAKAIGIKGLSVTMPLKEKILPFIDEIKKQTEQIGAANTLFFKEERIYETNTDGLGALNAIEAHGKVSGKHIVLLGAGGAARAIASEAHRRGADVTILNRTLSRAEEIAKMIGGKAGGLDAMPNDYDILINCSPSSMPIHPETLIAGTIVMDIVYVPRKTRLLKAALQRGCKIIYGEEMFLHQAAGQTKFWLEPSSLTPV